MKRRKIPVIRLAFMEFMEFHANVESNQFLPTFDTNQNRKQKSWFKK